MTRATDKKIVETVTLMATRWSAIVAACGGLTNGYMLASLLQAKREGLRVVIPGGQRTYDMMKNLFNSKYIAPSVSKKDLIDRFIVKINDWEIERLKYLIRDVLHWQTDKQLLIALNIAGVDLEDLKTEFLKGRELI